MADLWATGSIPSRHRLSRRSISIQDNWPMTPLRNQGSSSFELPLTSPRLTFCILGGLPKRIKSSSSRPRISHLRIAPAGDLATLEEVRELIRQTSIDHITQFRDTGRNQIIRRQYFW